MIYKKASDLKAGDKTKKGEVIKTVTVGQHAVHVVYQNGAKEVMRLSKTLALREAR